MSLKDDLISVHGIGDAKADEIISIVESHNTDGVDRELVARAYDKLQKGRKDLALNALERALDE